MKKILSILALLCAVAQGAWADDYGYPTKTKPSFETSYKGKSNVVVIKTAAELAYITEHFSEGSGYNDNKDWDALDYYLDADLDMENGYSWLPLGRESYWVTKFEGKFWGNGHTIRYMIHGLDEENQGLFSTIDSGGEVHDVNVVCEIYAQKTWVGGIAGESWGLIENCTVTCDIQSDHNLVGGIVGENCPGGTVTGCHVMGTIKATGDATEVGGIAGRNSSGGLHVRINNCWVEADVSSEYDDKAYVGGICGDNMDYLEYCCMTGNVTNPEGSRVGGIAGSSVRGNGSGRSGGGSGKAHCHHVTFYGTITNSSSRENDLVGKYVGYMDNLFKEFNQAEYDAAIAAGHTLYANAIKNVYAVNVSTTGDGTISTVDTNAETTDLTKVPIGHMVRVTVRTGFVESISIKDANNNDVEYFARNQYGENYYWFAMPRSNVNITVNFKQTAGSGTEADPYRISTAAEWIDFKDKINDSETYDTYKGKYYLLTNDISFGHIGGMGNDDLHPFEGTFDGGGHTMTVGGQPPFRYVKDATIKNLHVAGNAGSALVPYGSIVMNSQGALTLTNCRSSVDFYDGDQYDYHGGLVGSVSGSAIIEGCVFDGVFHSNGYTASYSGFIGEVESGSTVTIRNSLMKPSSVDANLLSNTFSKGTPTIENSYFVAVTNLPTNQGAQGRTISAGDDVTISNLGAATTTYGSNGITAYTKGIKYGDTYYVGSGETVNLTLRHGSKTGYTFSQYTASAGTLSGTTLTMPAQDVTISAAWTRNEYDLADDADNTTFITAHDGDVYDITLAGRTLYKDGKWNTLCLPFDVDLTADGCPLAGATARYLSEASVSGTTLNLTFSDPVTTLYAGEPYIIKWASGTNLTEANLVFTGVTIYNINWNYDTDELNTDTDPDNDVTTDQRVRFLGTYKSTAFDATDNTVLLLGGANTLYYPGNGAGLGAQRAYFKLGDGTALARRLTGFNIDFGDESTGIVTISKESGSQGASTGWYTLDGRRLSQKPSRAGIYINNGNKVVIK